MPALYPSTVAPENFQIGECVRKWVSEWNVTPFTGIVTQVVPATYKVWVQWPIGNASQEDPETLIKVNPAISGMPTVLLDSGYDSAEKAVSERDHGKFPHRITPSRDLTKPRAMPMMFSSTNKMAIRIAHTFAEDTIGKLVGDICSYKKAGLSDITTYNRIFNKYGSYCSDHIIRTSIDNVYGTKRAMEPNQIPEYVGFGSSGELIPVEADFDLDVRDPDTEQKIDIPVGETIELLGVTPQKEIVIQWKKKWKNKVFFVKKWNVKSHFQYKVQSHLR